MAESTALQQPSIGGSAFEALKRAGFLFMNGSPPQSEDGGLIVWDGDCGCRAAMWRDGQLVTMDWSTPDRVAPQSAPLDPSAIICWMRLPHPSIWPEIAAQRLQAQNDLFDGPDYASKRAAFRQALGSPA